jgi:Pectinacetylesterase
MRGRTFPLYVPFLLLAFASTDLGCGGDTDLGLTTGTAGDSSTAGANTGGSSASAGAAGSPSGGTAGQGGNAGGGTGGAGGSNGGMGGTAMGGSSTGGTSTGGTSTGGSGGSGPLCTPEGDFNGAPVSGNDGQWVWVDVPEAKCRGGGGTGFGVRLNAASDKLFIFFEGGGACFNTASCFGNADSYSQNAFNGWTSGGGKSGVFDTANAANALKDWNAVYIPYCTGDVHAGSATDADVPGGAAPKNQSFVGFTNVGHFLQRIIPTFMNVKKVVVTGVSAGGFGAAFNYHRIAQAFCPRPAILIDDSGPAMDDQYVAPCLQERWRTLWGLNDNLPADCADCSPAGGGGILNYMDYLSQRYPGGRLTLISSTQDSTIRQFYGFGQNNCAGLDGFGMSLPAATYTAGLTDLRDNHEKPPALWASYYLPGTTHTYLGGGGYTSTTVGNTKLIDWVADVVNDGPMVNVGP